MPSFTPFKLERYFGEYEFKARYLLSASDCESVSLKELLALADGESRALWENLSLSYTESQGHPLLRAEIAKLYPALTAEQTLIAVPEECIFIAMNTLLQAGDHVIAISPAYQSLYDIARGLGCDVSPWRLTVESGQWQADVAHLETLIRPATKLLVINFPHNPTGYLPSRETLEAILAIARKHGLYVFSDEMYRWLEHDAGKRLPAVCEIYERGITLSGLSKSFALPGLRMGWLATQDKTWIERWLTFKDYTTICHSAPSEILAIMALRAKEPLVARNLEIVLANTQRAAAFCTAHANVFEWLAPNAGSIAFPRWRGAGTVEAFCQTVLDHTSVMIVPGEMFDMPGTHFRLGLGRRNFEEALGKLEEYLQKL